jgi:hypothetical protein
LHLFNFLYRVRDLRPRWSTRRRAGFLCAILYVMKDKYNNKLTGKCVPAELYRKPALPTTFGADYVATVTKGRRSGGSKG